jgi:hypothetical protein
MSFRRDGGKAYRWQQWLAEHRESLTAAGVPDWVWSEELRWIRFLEEGGMDWESGWRVEMLSPDQAFRLRVFILRVYRHDEYSCLLRSLHRVADGSGRGFPGDTPEK